MSIVAALAKSQAERVADGRRGSVRDWLGDERGGVGTEEERVFFQTRVGYPLSPCSSRSLRLAPQDLSDPHPLK